MSTSRVLVVEDEASVRGVLRDALEAAGYEVETVGNAGTAITAARARRPDVILLNLGLPGGVTGDAAMPWLIRLAPVIIVTGTHNDELQRRLLSEGAFGYMRKPFDLTELVQMVRAAVAQGGSST